MPNREGAGSIGPERAGAVAGGVVETIFGQEVADPYRWLEDGESDRVRAWTEAQNHRTRDALDRVPVRSYVHARLLDLLSIGTVSAPAAREGVDGVTRYFHTRREGGQNQPVLYVREGVRGEDRLLFDPNALSAEGVVALDWWVPSDDGRYVAYGTSQNGDEESTLRVRAVSSGDDLPDRIERTRFASIAWLPDGTAFYYTRYPEPGSVPAGEEAYHRAVYLHVLGADPTCDALVFAPARMTDSPGIDLSPSGRWLLVSVHVGWARTELFLLDRSRDAEFSPIAGSGPADALFDAVVLDDAVYVRTNEGASRFRLCALDPEHPELPWRELVAESGDVLRSFCVTRREILATYLSDASSVLRRCSKSGEPLGVLELPAIGSSANISGRWNSSEVFYDFSSFAIPPTVYRCDLDGGAPEMWGEAGAPLDLRGFEVERLRAASRDGTVVPMFVVRRRGAPKGGRTPTLLTGYGGFNISMVPAFSRSACLLLEQGGAFVVANLRGGGEFGEAWHRAGMLAEKQNVFDDAVACAEALIAAGITDREHLAVMGGSNGGLLVGALITQRPDLFRAAVCSVPLLDMTRYHRFRIARLWISEYGSPEVKEDFAWLYAYSPYHRVVDGEHYPAVLFTAAESDTRVDPLHARKMAARLQAATRSGRSVLLRVETRAGHGAGKPVSKLVDELTDVYTFLFSELGIDASTHGWSPKDASAR